MSIYAGLDVSDKTTHVCVVDTSATFSAATSLRAIRTFWPSG